MVTEGNGQPLVFRVILAPSSKAKVVELYQKELVEGTGAEFLTSLRQIYQWLKTDPHVFGEPLYHLPGMKLVVRQAIKGKVVVDFAVHDEKPLVFVRGVKVLS